RQIAEAADRLGYFGVLLPTGKSCEDSWIVASALLTATEQLRFLVAVRPGLQPPTVAARMTATLDRLSGGRLLINVVTGGDAADRLIRYVDDQTIAKAQAIFARMDSVGQSRMAALHGGQRDKLEISPNLWAGVGLVRGGAGTALVGDPTTVAARMEEYREIG